MKQSITIMNLGYVFDQRYQAGETVVLTAGEASQFNQVLGENLRNNFAQVLKGRGAAWSVAERNGEFDSFQKAYQFGVRSTRESDPVESAIFDLLLPSFHAMLKAGGAVVSKIAKPEYETAYDKFADAMSKDGVTSRREKARPLAVEKIAEAAKTAKTMAAMLADF